MCSGGIISRRAEVASLVHSSRLLLNGSLTHGGLVWGPFRFRKFKVLLKHFISNEWARAWTQGPGPGPAQAQILAWVQARAHSFDIKCLSIILNFLNRKGPHTKPPCVKPPFNNNRTLPFSTCVSVLCSRFLTNRILFCVGSKGVFGGRLGGIGASRESGSLLLLGCFYQLSYGSVLKSVCWKQ